MISMPSLRDTALYNGVVHHFQVVYGLVYKSLTPGLAFSKGVIPPIIVGIYPQLSSNGANPVELLTLEFYGELVISN